MSDEGKDKGGESQHKSGELEEIKPDKDGKYPEVVPWKQYVGTKESLGKKLDATKEEVKSLEEKLKNAPNKEAFDKLVKEKDEATAKVKELTDEKTKAVEKTATELRNTLKEKGVPEDKLKDMSVAEMQTVLSVLGSKKSSLPDLGGGGGASGGLKGSPMELARQGYESSNKSKK